MICLAKLEDCACVIKNHKSEISKCPFSHVDSIVERADEVSNVESRVNMLEFDGKVHIHWDDPPNPNAPIITAEIEYRRRDAVVSLRSVL